MDPDNREGKVSEAAGMQRTAVQKMRDKLDASRRNADGNPKGELPTPADAFDLYSKLSAVPGLAAGLPAQGLRLRRGLRRAFPRPTRC